MPLPPPAPAFIAIADSQRKKQEKEAKQERRRDDGQRKGGEENETGRLFFSYSSSSSPPPLNPSPHFLSAPVSPPTLGDFTHPLLSPFFNFFFRNRQQQSRFLPLPNSFFRGRRRRKGSGGEEFRKKSIRLWRFCTWNWTPEEEEGGGGLCFLPPPLDPLAPDFREVSAFPTGPIFSLT